MTVAALPSQCFSLQLLLFLPARQPATLALQRQSREVLGMGMGKEMARAQGMAVKHRSRQALDRALTLTERSILAQAKPLVWTDSRLLVLGMGMGKEMARAQGMAVKHRSRQVPVQSQVRCSKGSEVNLAACKRR